MKGRKTNIIFCLLILLMIYGINAGTINREGMAEQYRTAQNPLLYQSVHNPDKARSWLLGNIETWLNIEYQDTLHMVMLEQYYYNDDYPARADSLIRYGYNDVTMQCTPDTRYIYQYDTTGEYMVRQDIYINNLAIPK